MSAFELDPRLAADCLPVGDLPLCRVLLMNDARFPWLVLVPRQAERVEVDDLDEADQARLWREVVATGAVLKDLTGGQKLNIAALGNQVRQLHVHVIARQVGDAAWPGPVWGQGQAESYPDPAPVLSRLQAALPKLQRS